MGDESEQVKRLYRTTLAAFDSKIALVANWLGPMQVAELERVATALYAMHEPEAQSDSNWRAERIHQLKPHVSVYEARKAVSKVDAFIKESLGLQVIAG